MHGEWIADRTVNLPFANRKLVKDSPVPAFCPMQLAQSPITFPTSKDLLLQIQSVWTLSASARISMRFSIGMLGMLASLLLPFVLPPSLFMLLISTLQVVNSCMTGEQIVWQSSGSVELVVSAAVVIGPMAKPRKSHAFIRWRACKCMITELF